MTRVDQKSNKTWIHVEMFYLNTIEQLFLFVAQLDQLEVCLPYSRLLTGIPILVVFQNLWWNSNKTSLYPSYIKNILLLKCRICPWPIWCVFWKRTRICNKSVDFEKKIKCEMSKIIIASSFRNTKLHA